METVIEVTPVSVDKAVPVWLSDIQKNQQVELLFSYMDDPNKTEECKDLLLEITMDCRLFANHLELEMAEHMANPEVYTMDDVKSSCKSFRRESISNVYGSISRKIQEYKQKDSENAMKCLKFAEGLWSSVRNKANEVARK